MKFNRIVLVVVSLALMLFALAGCGKDAAQDSQKKLNIVATTTMLTDLVKEIGGDHVSVQGLMGPGVDPHLYQASAGDVTAMSKADVVVYNGVHLEGKMGSIFDNLTKQNKATIRVSDAIDPATLLDFDEEDGVKTKDPHIWFESRVLVTAHDAFQYFARAYGFEVKGLQGVSTATEAGTQDVNELVQFIVDHKIKAIFVESSVPHKTIEAVQEAAKAKGWNVAIGGELYSDSLGSEGTEGGTYIGMVKANIDTIAKALK